MTEVSPLAGNPLRAILEVSTALVSSPVYEEVLARLVEKIGLAMNVWSCDLQAYIAERDACIYVAAWSQPGLSDDERAYLGTVTNVRDRPDLRDLIESTGLTEQHVDDPGLSVNDREQLTRWGLKSTLDMPLRVGDRVVGILGVQETRFVRRFTPAERDQFVRLCELAAVGMHDAQVLRADRERARHLGALFETGHALATVRESQEVFAIIARAAAEALDAPRALVYDYDAATEQMTARAIYQTDYDADYDTTGLAEAARDVVGDVACLRRTEPYVEQLSDPDLPAEVRESFELWNEKTALNAPLRYRGEPLGAIMVVWTDQEHLVTADEMALLRGFGQQAAVALATVRRRALGSGWRTRLEGSPE
ncbi:MAG TPA: GAF domain-containing protein [Thermoleophilia bacterium]|nr:GAF domain-containing protein [Thermoleophilia bacterium]